MNLSRLRVCLAAVPLVLAAAPAAAQRNAPSPSDAGRTIPVKASDLFEIRQLGSLAASPDGRRVVYTVTQAYREGAGADEKAGYRTHLWLVDAEGGAPPRALTRGTANASQPVWHPSGDTLAFVRSVDGKSQVFLMALSGGEAWAATALPGGASGPKFSPDGRRLLVSTGMTEADLRREGTALPRWLTVRSGERVRMDSTVRADPDGSPAEQRAWLDRNADRNRPRVATRLDFQSETDIDGAFRISRLFVVPVQGSEAGMPTARAVTTTWRSLDGAAWLPSGRMLVASTLLDTLIHPDLQTGGRGLVSIDVETGRVAPWLPMPGQSAGGPVVSPSGDALAFTTSDDGDTGFAQSEIAVVGLRGDAPAGAPRILTGDLDRSVGGVQWGRDGRDVFVTAASEGAIPLYRIPAMGGAPMVVVGGERGVQAYALAGTSGVPVVVAAITEWSNPYELWRTDLRTRRADAPLSDHNALDAHAPPLASGALRGRAPGRARRPRNGAGLDDGAARRGRRG